MTFKHKLSRRLAMMHRIVGLATPIVTLACLSGSSKLEEGLDPSNGLAAIVVAPRTAALQVDQTSQFTASGIDGLGATMAVSPLWSATGGQISNQGQYTASSNPGVYLLVALDPETGLADTATVTVTTGPPPPPPPPPPGSADVTLDFNDAANLGVNCAGSPCSWPYRKHTYNATAGRGGTGAIVMHWFTGMAIGYSPVWVTVPFPASRHMRIDYWVRQTASMTGTSSNQKVLRFRTNGSGLLYSMFNGPAGANRLGWYWEGYDANRSPTAFGSYTPDNQWHKHSVEINFKNVNNMVATFWLDDVLRGSSTTASPGGEQMPGNPTQYIISPFVEQYSCGTSPPCEQYINTGDYVVDDFAYTVLP